MAKPFKSQRIIRATPEQIYAAFSDPQKLAKWWGPNGFTNTFEIFEFKVGGRWKFIMHARNGTNYPNECTFERLEPGKEIVIRHTVAPLFTLTITLAKAAQGALLNWHQDFDDARVAESMQKIVGDANEQNLDRLEAVLKL